MAIRRLKFYNITKKNISLLNLKNNRIKVKLYPQKTHVSKIYTHISLKNNHAHKFKKTPS